MTDTPASLDHRRRRWLRTLALADASALAQRADAVLPGHAFDTLRAPEAGLVLLRGRIGGDGDRFNIGEATVARCVLRHTAPDGRVCVGVGHVLGRDLDRVRRIAALDAVLQRGDLHADLQRAVLQPLADGAAARAHAERAAAEATRVRFFTLQREAAA